MENTVQLIHSLSSQRLPGASKLMVSEAAFRLVQEAALDWWGPPWVVYRMLKEREVAICRPHICHPRLGDV